MLVRRLLATLLLLSALAAPAVAQTPVNHLISVLQASSQQLQTAAQLSSAQQAYAVVTQVVDQIFKAMQQMSLPYYQNQLQFLTSQQISLSNRLAALQTNISSNANMLFRMTGAVSSSLAAQTANIGSIVVLYQNTVSPKINQLTNQIQGLNALLPDATTQIANLTARSIRYTNKTQAVLDEIDTYVQNLADAIAFIQLYWTTVVDVPNNLPMTSAPNCVAYTVNLNRHYSVPPHVVVHAFSQTTGASNLALDPVAISVTQDVINLWLCDRSGTSFTYIPTRLFIEVVDQS